MKIILAADHRGFKLKEFIKQSFPNTMDVGSITYNASDDYVDFAKAAIEQLQPEDKAVLICGSGHGMDIVANKYAHIRAILGFNESVTKQGRNDEDANVLILPADWVTESDAQTIINAFLNTPFSNEPRHLRRLEKLNQL